MTPSGKNNLSDKKEKKVQVSPNGKRPWRSEAMNQEACAIVAHVVDGVRSILASVNEKEEEATDSFWAISKAILYHSLILTQKDPLFERISDALSDFDELKNGVCAHLFESMFEKDASGKDFEYFGCIFQSELDKLEADYFSFSLQGLERPEKVSTFDVARGIVQEHMESFLGKNCPTDELIEGVQKLLKVTSLRISKALLT